MFRIPTNGMSREFHALWHAAAQHLDRQIDGKHAWLRSESRPPFLEHLSFRLGNQLFYVRVESERGLPEGPGSVDGLVAVATACNGHACLMPMRFVRGEWRPAAPGWGLVGLRDGQTVDPPALVTEEVIEMTDWELQDFAVQVIRDMLMAEGREVMSRVGDPRVNPSIWFVGDEGPEWVVVRAVRHPATRARPPSNWAEIARGCAPLGQVGHFASLAVACKGPKGSGFLARGYGLTVDCKGLEPRVQTRTLLRQLTTPV